MPEKKPIELKIEKLNLGAQGIGFIDGKVFFVDFVVPGEIILAEVVLEKKDYSVAKCKKIIKPSFHRIEPRCPLFVICGGCHLQHIEYAHQVQLKKEILIDTLKRIGKIEYADIEVFTDEPWHYRNRAQLPVQNDGRLKIGYFMQNTHNVVDHKICFINQLAINETISIVRERVEKSGIEIYDEKTHQGNLRHIIIRKGMRTNQLFITFVTKEESIPNALWDNLLMEIPNLVGISQNINPMKTNRILGKKNINLVGTDYYEEIIHNRKFYIGANSFFQVNIPIFEKIIKMIKTEITGSRLLDLYAGVGVIGICVADLARDIIAIEENPEAVKWAELDAQLNRLNNIIFIAGKVEENIVQLKNIDTVILDPPRKGLAKEVVSALVNLKPKRIIYLSCNPATLSRDTKSLIEHNYHLKKMALFDMFPQTYHIEALVVLEI